jgi:cell cycle sensor histidine kinase DivJ
MAQVAGDRRLKSLLRSALRAGETREGASLQAIDDLVTWHDRNGSVLRANAAATKLLGASPTSLQGRGLFSRIHVADRPAFLKAISDAAHGAEPVVARIRLQVGEAPNGGSPVPARIGACPQGGLIWIEMRAHRLVTEEGCAVVAVSRDISEHKQHAEDLDALLREAETAGETRAGLLSTVSHELRVPLNAIIGYSEMLMGRGGLALASLRGDQREDYAEIIHRSGQHMLGVVSTLLDLSTIEAGHYGLSPEPIEVDELVEDCCRLMSLSADRSGVALAQDIAPGLPELRADRRACRQILINLLSNAVKFTPKGGLVTVQARRDGNRIVLAVRDTGVGVCAAELPRLGDPFYKGASGRNPAEKGSGLGLSVVRGLVGLHDGQISIASAPGNGTTVTVGLPIDAGHPARVAAPAKVHTFVRSADGAHHQDRMTKLA